MSHFFGDQASEFGGLGKTPLEVALAHEAALARNGELTRRELFKRAGQITVAAAAVGIILPPSASAASGVNPHTLTSNSTTVVWKPLTMSNGVKVKSQNLGGVIDAIATNGSGLRTASWFAGTLAYGYWRVDIQFPKNIGNATRINATYKTNPLRATTTNGSKVITLLPEGSVSLNLGAYSGNALQVGDLVSGAGIPAGAYVTVPPATRTASTFQINLAATLTSVTTGIPLTITRTFRNLLDQKTGYLSGGVDMFTNASTQMLPYKTSPNNSSQLYDMYVWVPPIAKSTNPGNMTITISDKGCGTATVSGGRMIADTIVFTKMNGLK